MSKVPVDQIKVGERQRKTIDPAKLTELADSISRLGLIHPITIDRDLNLIAGERRLRAHQQLKLLEIEVRYFEDLNTTERALVELEENLKRVDLPWQDYVDSLRKLHETYSSLDKDWTAVKTAAAVGLSPPQVSKLLLVAAEIQARPEAAKESSPSAVYGQVSRRTARAVEQELTEQLMPAIGAADAPAPALRYSILNESFLTWAPAYSGPPFNVLHCDFPYGLNMQDAKMQSSRQSSGRYDDSPELYTALMQALCNNASRLLAPSGYGIFWFSPKFREHTLTYLEHFFTIDSFDLIWHKSDLSGILPDPTRGPRRTYESALYLRWGDIPIVRAVSNSLAHPRGRSEVEHISEKPLPVVEHFLSMLVDDSSHVLDPTCGSGTALAAAMRLKAARVVGLDIEQKYCELARHKVKSSLATDSILEGL